MLQLIERNNFHFTDCYLAICYSASGPINHGGNRACFPQTAFCFFRRGSRQILIAECGNFTTEKLFLRLGFYGFSGWRDAYFFRLVSNFRKVPATFRKFGSGNHPEDRGNQLSESKKLSERPTTKAVSKDKNQNQEVKYYSDIRTLKPGP